MHTPLIRALNVHMECMALNLMHKLVAEWHASLRFARGVSPGL